MEFSLYLVQSEFNYRQAERIACVHTVLIEGSYVLSPSVTQQLFLLPRHSSHPGHFTSACPKLFFFLTYLLLFLEGLIHHNKFLYKLFRGVWRKASAIFLL